jgi:hypothetical protein
MADFIENDHVRIWLENEIVHVLYKKGAIIGLKMAKEIVALRLELQKGNSYDAIAYINDVATVSPDARSYLALEGSQGVKKVALITNSSISTLLGNIFIQINKPPRPTRLFKNKEAALKWLKGK